MLETIVGDEEEKSKAVQDLVNQDGNLVSEDHSIMYREGHSDGL